MFGMPVFAERARRARMARLLCAFVLFVGAGLGCRPTFTDGVCTVSSDCFENEVCQGGTCRVMVEVEPVDITSFTADPTTALVGEMVTLSWQTQNTTQLALTGSNGFTTTIASADIASGSVGIEVSEDTTFTLVATNSGSREERTVTVTTMEEVVLEPRIVSFTATPDRIGPGGAVTLEWEVADGVTAAIDNDQGRPAIALSPGEIANGSATVNPAATTTYTLRV
ncbi:MAG: hypothetical protein AAGI01_13675, partial [Myxococcota bacterium]